MKLRTVALALALACGFTAADARPKPASHFRNKTKNKKYKPKAQKYKPRKIKHA